MSPAVSCLEAGVAMYMYKMNATHCNFYLLAFYASTTQHKWLKKVSGTVSSDLNATASKPASSNGLKHRNIYFNLKHS